MYHDDDFEPRRSRRRPLPRIQRRELVAPPAEGSTQFANSVQVTKAERAWIIEHLGPFHDSRLIEDVAARIKAGKEATVYACTAPPGAEHPVIAAKLYRVRSLRGEQNAGRYQQGRSILTVEGGAALPRAWRLHKAIAQRSAKGVSAMQTSWLLHEHTLLCELHARGGHVPKPLAHNEYALLMELIGEGLDPAPTLQEVALAPREAKQLLEQLLFDVELLLELGWVHGDLSAYNILYRPRRAVLIDFPQVVNAHENPDARALFERDLERLARYFEPAGAPFDHLQHASALWARYVADPQLDDGAA
jgi:RIO kinase 1